MRTVQESTKLSRRCPFYELPAILGWWEGKRQSGSKTKALRRNFLETAKVDQGTSHLGERDSNEIREKRTALYTTANMFLRITPDIPATLRPCGPDDLQLCLPAPLMVADRFLRAFDYIPRPGHAATVCHRRATSTFHPPTHTQPFADFSLRIESHFISDHVRAYARDEKK